MAAVITVNVWRGLPFFAITVLAGLVAVPREYLEAAEVDGASSWGRFWHVTLPLIKPVLAVVILIFDDLHVRRFQHRAGADARWPSSRSPSWSRPPSSITTPSSSPGRSS